MSQSLRLDASPPPPLRATAIPISGRFVLGSRMVISARLVGVANARRMPNGAVLFDGHAVGRVVRARLGRDYLALHISITNADTQRAITAGELDSLVLTYEYGPVSREVRFYDVELAGGVA